MEETLESIKEALDSLKEPLFLLNGSLDCVYGNASFFQLLSNSTPQGKDSLPFPAERFWPKISEANWSADELVTELITEAGSAVVVKLTATPCRANWRFCRIVSATSKDDSLINFHAQRLETLGVLAGGIAHDFNNILTGILGHITYLKTILPSTGLHVESLNAIEDGARRASTMTQQILDFSRLETSDKATPIDLCGVVARTCALLRGAISPRFELEWTLASHELLVLAQESKIAQVIINLAINARDAIQPGGFIIISIEVERDLERVRAAYEKTELLTERFARLSVVDNGHGIPQELIDKIFQPYFSTREGKGTGLGLATVRSIVQVLGGAIEVTSEVGQGTGIHVFLPLLGSSSLAKTSKEEEKPAALVGGSERILIVDDEYPVRNVLSVSLEHLGYSVQAVASGFEAIELFRADPQGFDLVILDMLMPHMSGKDVFCELKKLNSDVRVLAISGFTSEESIRYILDNGGKGFVQKPFTIEDLSHRVRACFD